ncbi:hypothetical protein F2P79_011172 [Pimephales promelas]|nr:hypothetical protein F2P79_011172 [Pimephales promelas]
MITHERNIKPEKLYTAVVRVLSALMSAGTASKPCCKTSICDPGSAVDFRTNVQGKGGKGHGLYRPGLLSLQITPNGSP